MCSQPGKQIARCVGWGPTEIVRECYFKLHGSAETEPPLAPAPYVLLWNGVSFLSKQLLLVDSGLSKPKLLCAIQSFG